MRRFTCVEERKLIIKGLKREGWKFDAENLLASKIKKAQEFSHLVRILKAKLLHLEQVLCPLVGLLEPTVFFGSFRTEVMTMVKRPGWAPDVSITEKKKKKTARVIGCRLDLIGRRPHLLQ